MKLRIAELEAELKASGATSSDAAKALEDEKKILRLLGKAPVDPALTGVYQSIVQAVLAPKAAEGGEKGAAFTSKKDPARAEDHGHLSGVRRDSAGEKGK